MCLSHSAKNATKLSPETHCAISLALQCLANYVFLNALVKMAAEIFTFTWGYFDKYADLLSSVLWCVVVWSSFKIVKTAMTSRRKKYALIWWIEYQQKDVIELSVIPKKSREVDAVATLQWNDVKAKKTTQLKAKVLAISGKYIIFCHCL